MSSSIVETRYRASVGVLIGLTAAGAVMSLLDGNGGRSPGAVAGPLLSDCDGAIEQIAIHYVAEAGETVVATYRDLLSQLPADVAVHVVCPGRSDYDDLLTRVGPTECLLSPVLVGHPITCWSRDRWLALAPAEKGAAAVLVAPRGEMGADLWPARRGDQRVADDLAAALARSVAAIRSELYFDGGDFVADDRTAFVTPAVLRRNLQHTVQTREELLKRLSAMLRREVVLLEEAPDHHAGMFMMPVGDRTILVGDPAAAERLLAASGDTESAALRLPDGPDFADATGDKFNAVAKQCRAAGYRVVRIPIVPASDGRTYVTYLNAILDQRQGRRIVYMPVFNGADSLNRTAENVWAGLGYEVRRVNCDACYPHFGSLRCLVNVVHRGIRPPCRPSLGPHQHAQPLHLVLRGI